MSRVLLLFTADLMTIRAMHVVSSPGALTAVVLALAGAGGMSSSSEMSETSSKLKVSSLTREVVQEQVELWIENRVPCLGCVLKTFQSPFLYAI
jgi:hypothetical protein